LQLSIVYVPSGRPAVALQVEAARGLEHLHQIGLLFFRRHRGRGFSAQQSHDAHD
jgi:hypothetical protein